MLLHLTFSIQLWKTTYYKRNGLLQIRYPKFNMMNACSKCIHIKNTLLVLLPQFPSAYEPYNLVHLFHCFNDIISPRYPNHVHSSLLHAATSRCSSPTYNISCSVIFFDFKNLLSFYLYQTDF